jgi:hypothetical protein
MKGGGADNWSSGMRERREILRTEGREASVLKMREGMGELLEVLQCTWLTHFGDLGDEGRDGGVVGDSLRLSTTIYSYAHQSSK